MSTRRPAWSSAFAGDALPRLGRTAVLDNITPEWAWGDSSGKGIKVAVIDSGIDAQHPDIAGRVAGYVAVSEGPDGPVFDIEPHGDLFGHGTACAAIIRAAAPECDLYSVRVLGERLSGRGATFAAGLQWAIRNGMQVCNLSLGTTRRDYYGLFHELADAAYFNNVMLVTAANNMPIPSFPSVYASVFSVAAHDQKDPSLFYYNPTPPVEFGAAGIDLRVAWLDGGWITATGNSFAAPHISGIVARILAKHPELNIFQMKTVLQALAGNVGGG
jgi:subtilisin